MNLLRHVVILGFIGSTLGISQVAEAQPAVEKRLVQKISIDVKDHSAIDLLRELGDKHKLPVDFDPSIEATGLLGGDTAFTLTAEGLTLRSVIQLACESLELNWRVENGRLLVATNQSETERMIVREYPLAVFGVGFDPQVLAEELPTLTSGPWMDRDAEGGAITAITPRSLTIRQSHTVHQELQTLFDQLSAANGRARPPSVQERADQMLLRKLQTPSQFSAESSELPQLLDQLLTKNGVPYWVDKQSLGDEGIDWTKLSSTVEAKKMPTAARLDAIATEHKLSWRVGNEVVMITTAYKGAEQMTTRVYNVRRLIGPNRPAEALAAQLMSNAELGPWMVNDAEGGMVLVAGNLLLVRHNAKVLEKITKLLN
jgi:hypothetical protein